LVLGSGSGAEHPMLGPMRIVAGLLQNRRTQTTAIWFEAEATSIIDDTENGWWRGHRATYAGGCYAGQNAHNPDGVPHGFLLCVIARVSYRRAEPRRRCPGATSIAQGTTSGYPHKPAIKCAVGHTGGAKLKYSDQDRDGASSKIIPGKCLIPR